MFHGALRLFLLLEAVFIPALLVVIDSVPCYAMLQRMSQMPKAWFHIALSPILF